ncbi:LOW QUALITY PROTEIN: uncharacterized protein ACMZJ9_010829 [Mantella aurantiaca]
MSQKFHHTDKEKFIAMQWCEVQCAEEKYNMLYLIYIEKRYIDDVFILWKSSKIHVKDFVNRLNINMLNMQFTHVIVANDLPFLDVMVKIEADLQLKTSVSLPLWRSLGWDKWDSSVPYNWDTPWFYLETFMFIKDNELQVKPDLWKPKTIHKLIRAKDTMESVPGLPSDTCKYIWRNVSSKRLTNRHKDLAWMAIQGGLPTRTFMHARNLCRYRHCPFCVIEEETPLHLFWQCEFAQRLLAALEHELRDLMPQTAITHCAVLYGLFCGEFTEDEIKGAWRVMCCLKDAIWCARKRLIHQRETMSIEDCRRLIHSLLRDYNLMDRQEEEDI